MLWWNRMMVPLMFHSRRASDCGPPVIRNYHSIQVTIQCPDKVLSSIYRHFLD